MAKDRVKEHAKKVLWERSQKCALCGKPFRSIEEVTLDHIVPRNLGGRTRLMNLQLAHYRCNSKKSNKLAWFSTTMMKAFEIIPSRLDENGKPKM
jgi:5-methylcytosine-specific restriction endonuclease McrA